MGSFNFLFLDHYIAYSFFGVGHHMVSCTLKKKTSRRYMLHSQWEVVRFCCFVSASCVACTVCTLLFRRINSNTKVLTYPTHMFPRKYLFFRQQRHETLAQLYFACFFWTIFLSPYFLRVLAQIAVRNLYCGGPGFGASTQVNFEPLAVRLLSQTRFAAC